MRACSAWYFSTRCFKSSMALVSAPVAASIFLWLAAISNKTAIQILATMTSTVTITEKISPPTSNISFIEAWFAPPPIQLPATVVMPRHTASGPCPPTIVGSTALTTNIARGPPITIPSVPTKNIISALGPKFKIAFKSMLIVKSIKQAGNK